MCHCHDDPVAATTTVRGLGLLRVWRNSQQYTQLDGFTVRRKGDQLESKSNKNLAHTQRRAGQQGLYQNHRNDMWRH